MPLAYDAFNIFVHGTVLVAFESGARANDRRGGVPIPSGKLPDLRRLHATHRRRLVRGPAPCLGQKSLGAQHMLSHERLVQTAEALQFCCQGPRQDHIGTRPNSCRYKSAFSAILS